MKKRKGFTLVELLVVIGLILILISLLLPSLNHLYSNAQVSQAKLDLNSITAALENYKQDFGDYPRNTFLPTFGGVPVNGGYNLSGLGTPNNIPPFCLPLAAALVGPGPATTNLVSIPGSAAQSIATGDGADGPGFKDRSIDFATQVQGATFPSQGNQLTSIQVNDIPASWKNTPINPYASQVAALVASSASVVIAPGQYNQETMGIKSVGSDNGTPPIYTLTLNCSAIYNHSASEIVVLRTATGKVWQPYLPSDSFKVQWVNRSGQPIEAFPNQYVQGQPVLLDRWGTPIQYFVRNGANSNRTGDSKDFASLDNTVLVGPLYGISTPHSIISFGDAYGTNAIWDEGYAVGPDWQRRQPGTTPPEPTPSPTNDPTLAFRWMLGVEANNALQGDKTINNVIRDPDKLRYTGDYILISAGPDAQFCNFVDPKSPSNLAFQSNLLLSKFKASRNVYNFER
jgi:general secretion pathway protein G